MHTERCHAHTAEAFETDELRAQRETLPPTDKLMFKVASGTSTFLLEKHCAPPLI